MGERARRTRNPVCDGPRSSMSDLLTRSNGWVVPTCRSHSKVGDAGDGREGLDALSFEEPPPGINFELGLQKFRLGKQLHPENSGHEGGKGGSSDIQVTSNACSDEPSTSKALNQEGFQISEAIRMQMEAQRRLQEQLEVQRELQLRIEAQGKYLQTILEKAKEALGRQIGESPGLETVHAKLTELVSKVNIEPMNMSFPPFTSVEAPTHIADTNISTLPCQEPRISDSSSQKSHVTNVAANPEDSGDASASCENHPSIDTLLSPTQGLQSIAE
ncbi:myb family transcription factor PHL8 isoform X3 [Physcomitrium patens]|uniref:myb family transcription factor PHL8 isoform X3 n=1 Tax=Physcomitrium patens TaxID=3218 RepID=UPI000D16830C|nr:protein PHR1-LIKE 2-like isoform X3 [Physcomitrium patens]|eukprot:XP_024391152.1 protein PHR1-LIKE 2-like isoform X3 [Physcomitrella patens]